MSAAPTAANATFLGVLRVDAGDLAAAARPAAAHEGAAGNDIVAPARDDVVGGDDFVGPDDEARTVPPFVTGGGLAPLLERLVAGGVPVSPVYLRRLGWTRDPAGVAQLDGADQDRLQLDSSVKGYDSPVTTFLVSPYSRHLARWAARRGLSPDQVTVLSLLIGIAAAAAFAADQMPLGAVLAVVAFVTDCVDGQLARYTRRYSKRGAYLDTMFDRAKEYVIYAGLALGGDVWLLACAALALQTTRHVSDFAFAAARRPPAPSAALAAWRRTDPSLKWVKRALPFPIGERFAVIAIAAPLFGPEVTFLALLGGTAIGIAYTHAGRVLRAPSPRWLARTLLCATVFAAVIAVAAIADALPAAFAVLFAAALALYDRNVRR